MTRVFTTQIDSTEGIYVKYEYLFENLNKSAVIKNIIKLSSYLLVSK